MYFQVKNTFKNNRNHVSKYKYYLYIFFITHKSQLYFLPNTYLNLTNNTF